MKPLLPDDLWNEIEPLLPKPRPHPKGGRPPLDNRKALTGIIFILKTGIPWEYLPAEMGCGCGMTCWRRLKAWFLAGVWDQIHTVLLSRLRFLKKLDFSRFLIDTSHVRAVGGGAPNWPQSSRSVETRQQDRVDHRRQRRPRGGRRLPCQPQR